MVYTIVRKQAYLTTDSSRFIFYIKTHLVSGIPYATLEQLVSEYC